MVRHHSEPGLNVLNELRLTLSSPALKNFKTSAGSVKSSGDFSLLPRLSKNKRHPFVMAKVRFSARSPKKQPPKRMPRWPFIQRLQGEGYGGARRDRTDDLLLAKQALSQLSYGPIRFAEFTFMRGARQGKTGREGRIAPCYLPMGVPGQPFFWLRSREIGRQ